MHLPRKETTGVSAGGVAKEILPESGCHRGNVKPAPRHRPELGVGVTGKRDKAKPGPGAKRAGQQQSVRPCNPDKEDFTVKMSIFFFFFFR